MTNDETHFVTNEVRAIDWDVEAAIEAGLRLAKLAMRYKADSFLTFGDSAGYALAHNCLELVALGLQCEAEFLQSGKYPDGLALFEASLKSMMPKWKATKAGAEGDEPTESGS